MYCNQKQKNKILSKSDNKMKIKKALNDNYGDNREEQRKLDLLKYEVKEK